MLGKSGKNSHSPTVIVDGNSAQISLHRFTQISTDKYWRYWKFPEKHLQR